MSITRSALVTLAASTMLFGCGATPEKATETAIEQAVEGDGDVDIERELVTCEETSRGVDELEPEHVACPVGLAKMAETTCLPTRKHGAVAGFVMTKLDRNRALEAPDHAVTSVKSTSRSNQV